MADYLTLSGQQAVPVSPQEFYEVNITKAQNGFIIRVGCKIFVAKTWAEASAALKEYYDDPVKARKKYCKEA